MDSSYLAASLRRFEDTIDILKTNYEEVKNNLDAEKEKHQELNRKYEEVKKKIRITGKITPNNV